MSRGFEFGRQWEGQTVDGRFPLQRYLGGSTSSAVFLTLHRNGKAAIKLRQLGAQEAEAQLAHWRKGTELLHPHLLRIFEAGRCWLAGSELVYAVSECAEENLAEVLPRRALSIAEAEDLLRPALDVLHFLHQRGLVCARLRPSNVMSVSEQLKISGDGIRPAGKAEPPTETSIYDAPETRTGMFSPASDVWSLGVTLAEAFTQKPPTNASDVLEAGLPQPFADIVQHCLRQNPNQRWTPKEMSARLAGQTEPHFSGAPRDRATGARKAALIFNPWLLVSVAVLVIAGVIFAFVHRGSGNSVSSARQQANASTPTPGASPTATPSNEAASPSASSSAPGASAPGAVLNRVIPNPSLSARNTIHGKIKVRVKVSVDSTGNITATKLVTPGPSKYFARLAMEAARQWKFAPSTAQGRPIPSEWTLLFEFARSGTQAEPTESR